MERQRRDRKRERGGEKEVMKKLHNSIKYHGASHSLPFSHSAPTCHSDPQSAGIIMSQTDKAGRPTGR